MTIKKEVIGRLQRHIAKRVGDKEYVKYEIVISNKIMPKLDWKKGDDLIIKAEENKLIISKKLESPENLGQLENENDDQNSPKEVKEEQNGTECF